jgi:hypothetical protein
MISTDECDPLHIQASGHLQFCNCGNPCPSLEEEDAL